MCESIEDCRWLYRGVPAESREVADVEYNEEVTPPRRDLVGEYWRAAHIERFTNTGYTSWTTDRSFAEEAARECSIEAGLSGHIRIFRIPTRDLESERIYEGRADEYEYLLEGTVENVRFSETEADDEDD